MRVRPAAVAGYFYPGEPGELRNTLESLLAENPAVGCRPKALVVPHAGYPYSGPVAARAYNRLRLWGEPVRRVVLLGPSHRVPLRGLALPDVECFQTPLGSVPLDPEGMAAARACAGVAVVAEAHALEHSLEVQLPFLQEVLESFTLVPLVVGGASCGQVAKVLEVLWGGEETLILVSTDLSHYHPSEQARKLDRQTSERILHGESSLSGEEACGCHPLNGLLEIARRRQLRIELLDLRNSGDTAGSRESVVGYGAYALYE